MIKLSQNQLDENIHTQFSSVQFSPVAQSCPTLRPHESQHARPPCPSPTPRVHSDSHPSSRWCHQAISSSVVPFSSCPQSLPASVSSLSHCAPLNIRSVPKANMGWNQDGGDVGKMSNPGSSAVFYLDPTWVALFYSHAQFFFFFFNISALTRLGLPSWC